MDYDIIPQGPSSTTQINDGNPGVGPTAGGDGGGGVIVGGVVGVGGGGGGGRAPKIPRPANAFMLYANANRKKMARAYPLDSNKEISKRLGRGWKELVCEEKNVFYEMAKKVDAAHKAKYPDYVYNPKEARIRKAMRDANRERTMGVAPSSRASRRSQPWVLQDQEDQFMMTTGHGMRGVPSPMCGNGFPIVGSGAAGAQFMSPMHAYNKHVHLGPHDQSPYLQTNPMAQLQHQTEMWHYHESTSPMRPTGEQFMLPSQISTYHQHQQQQQQQTQDIDAVREKMKAMEAYGALPEDSQSHSPHSNANVSPASDPFDECKDTRSISTGGSPQQTSFGSMELYQEDVIIQNPFEKDDSITIKRNTTTTTTTRVSSQTTKPHKSLPDFNAAFGTTERGRFQSPPDPHLQPKQGYLDFYLPNNDLKFDDFNI